MTNDNEQDVLDISKILTGEVSIRKVAKQFGLRRDDLINRIKEARKDYPEDLKQLDFIILMNKYIFDEDITLEEVAKQLDMPIKELDKKIIETLVVEQDKLQRYLDKKKCEEKSKRSK